MPISTDLAAPALTPETQLRGAFLDVLDAYSEALPSRFLPDGTTLGVRRELAANPLPALRWLQRIKAIVAPQASGLAELLCRDAALLRWGQTYQAADFGEGFLANYGWLEVFGARGHFVHPEIAGGLLLLGPETFYPEHRHAAEEIYLPLTGGTEWFMEGQGWRHREAGEVVHHPSNVVHAMRTAGEPLLALYLWRGGALDQRSEILAQPRSQTLRG